MTTLVGTGGLIRFILRQDRLRLAVWVAVLALVPVSTASALGGLYPTEAARQQLAASVAANPAMVAILGPVHGSSIGALTAWRVGAIGSLLVGLMAVLTMIRHTRAEEETERRELLGSTVVGRHAPLAAALAVTVGTGVALGLVLTAGMLGVALPLSGALAFGLGFAGVALVFATAGAVAAQLTEGSGTARGIAVTAVGLAFLLRTAGDGGEASGLSWLSWLSPIGWFNRLQSFSGEQWWVLALPAGLALLLTLVAFGLSSRRDVGAGVFAPRMGPASAGAGLAGPFGLAWRLERGSLLAWSIGMAVMGVVYGSVGDSIGDLLDDSPQLAEIFELLGGEQGITDAFFSAAVSILALIAAAYAVRAVLRLRVEEEENRAEPVLATATPRVRWASSHLAFGVLGPAVMLTLAGAMAGGTYGLIIGDIGGQTPRVAAAALVQLPAVWVLTGVAMALFGLVPRFVAVSWGALMACLLLTQLGQILQLPQWALNISPFSHIPLFPAEELEAPPLMGLVLVAAGLMAAGLTGLRHRDMD